MRPRIFVQSELSEVNRLFNGQQVVQPISRAKSTTELRFWGLSVAHSVSAPNNKDDAQTRDCDPPHSAPLVCITCHRGQTRRFTRSNVRRGKWNKEGVCSMFQKRGQLFGQFTSNALQSRTVHCSLAFASVVVSVQKGQNASSDYDALGNRAEERDTATGGIAIKENERLDSGNGWVRKYLLSLLIVRGLECEKTPLINSINTELVSVDLFIYNEAI